MPTPKCPRPEALTTAKWWGNVLRDLVIILKPVQTLTDEDVSDKGDPIDQAYKRAFVAQAKKVVGLLTLERINTFQNCLAEIVEAEMNIGRRPFCSLIQAGQRERSNNRLIHQALERAGIDPFPFGGGSIFLQPKSTFTEPGEVQAIDENGVTLLKIVNE